MFKTGGELLHCCKLRVKRFGIAGSHWDAVGGLPKPSRLDTKKKNQRVYKAVPNRYESFWLLLILKASLAVLARL
jgi:hypothetical protein